MERRDFLEKFNIKPIGLSKKTNFKPHKKQIKPKSYFGLDEYVPTTESPWNRFRVKHLLRRACVGEQKRDTVDFFLSLTPSKSVDKLFDFSPLPTKPTWTDEAITFPIDDDLIWERHVEFMEWAFSLAYFDTTIRENMVNFWVNHFVVQTEKVYFPNFMVNFNQLFRQYATGDFSTLTKNIGKSPAMLIYLDGWDNNIGSINENYARELQELFTIGIGNYTQLDISEAARAFTGWNIRFRTVSSYFDTNQFDDGEKIFYGETGNFNGDDIIDIILSKRESALFMAEKIYKHFVYYIPDEEIVSELATVIEDSNFNLEIPIKTLLKSKHFMDSVFFGADIKSPLSFIAGALRNLNISTIDYERFGGLMWYYNQIPFDPPNVEGWKEHHKWINTSILPKRLEIGYAIFYYLLENLPFDHIEFLSQYQNRYDARKLVTDIVEDFYPFEISEETKEEFVQILVDYEDVSTWNPDTVSRNQIGWFLIVLMQQPEFQLG